MFMTQEQKNKEYANAEDEVEDGIGCDSRYSFFMWPRFARVEVKSFCQERPIFEP